VRRTDSRWWQIPHLGRWVIPEFAILGVGWCLWPGTPAPITVLPVETPPAPNQSVPARLVLTNDGGTIVYSGALHDESTQTTIISSLRDVFGASEVKGTIAVNPSAGPVPWLVSLPKAIEYLKTPGARVLFDGSLMSVLGISLGSRSLNDNEVHLIS